MIQEGLPSDWELSTVESISERITKGSTPTTYGYNYEESGIPFLRAENISFNSLDLTNLKHISPETHKFLSRSIIKPGDVLITIAGTIGRAALVPQDSNEMNSNQAVAIIRVSDKCLPSYLSYFLNSNLAKKQILESKVTTSISNLSLTEVGKLKLPIPPKETQIRIVKKLDSFLWKLVTKKNIILKVYSKKKNKLQFVSEVALVNAIVKLMKLDDRTWKNEKLEDICESIQPGFAQGEKNVTGGTIHLRMNNISTNFEINLDLIRTVNASTKQLEKYYLKEGDVIFNNTNSTELVGKSAIFTLSKICLYSNHLTRLRVKRDLVLPDWLLFYLRGRWIRKDFERMCNKWINQAAVNNDMIRNMKIPVPSLKDQQEIVKKLQNISSAIKDMEIKTKQILVNDGRVLNYLEKLPLTILDLAFSGKWIDNSV